MAQMGTVLKGMEGVVRGYRPQVDWGGEEGSPTIVMGGHNVKLGTSGWRKRCLFILLGSLFIIALSNLIMTFYLLKKIKFHTDGAGQLLIEVGGVKLDGIARFDYGLTVSNIEGQQDKDLEILGYYNFSAATVTSEGGYGSGVVLDTTSGLVAVTKGIRFKNQKGKLLFEVRENGTRVGEGAKFFTVTGDGGANLEASIQTPRILGDEVHEFRIESKTRSVIGRAAEVLEVESRAGDVTMTSLNDAILTAENGKFRFESPNVFVPNLLTEGGLHPMDLHDPKRPTWTSTQTPIETQIPAPDVASPTPTIQSDSSYSDAKLDPNEEHITVYQVCVCPNGKLFLSAADFVCNPDENTCK